VKQAVFSAVLIFCVSSVSGTGAAWMPWFAPDLRAVEREDAAVRRDLKALGPVVTGRAVPEAGYMDGRSAVPPPVATIVQVDLLASLPVDAVALVPALHDAPTEGGRSYGFPQQFRVDLSDDPEFAEFSPVAAFMEADFPEPGISPAVFVPGGLKARYVRLTVTKPAVVEGQYGFALAELMVLSGQRNVAIGKPVKAKRSVAMAPRWATANLVDGRTPLGPPVRLELLPQDGVFISMQKDGSPGWFRVDLGREVPLQEVRLHPVHARLGSDVPGYAFPARFRVEAAADAEFSQPVVLLDAGARDFSNPANHVVTVPAAGGVRARYVRVLVLAAGDPVQHQRAGLAEIEVYSGGVNVARGAVAATSLDDQKTTQAWPRSLLVDGYASFGRIVELPEWLAGWKRRGELQAQLAALEPRQAALTALARQRAVNAGAAFMLLVVAVAAGWILLVRRQRTRDLETLRARLARDFHDEIGSNLAGIAVVSEMAAKSSAPDSALHEDWLDVHRMAQETTDVMREVLWVAGAREGMGIDLMKHLQLVARRLLRRQEVRWLEVAPSLPPEWPIEARRQVFLFFKETLTNIARHSEARTVELSARVADGFFELIVRDDGAGFLPGAAPAGIGLQSLRERAKELRGSCAIDTAPGRGTEVRLRLPLKK